MIHPSYSELINAINTNSDEDDTILVNSRYSLVLATSKRARQIIAGAEPLVDGVACNKPLSIAIDELYKGKVKILAGEEETEETANAAPADAVAEETAAETVEEESTTEEEANATE